MDSGNVELPTGCNLYYEVHGRGEHVVLLQGTGFSLDVWTPDPTDALARDRSIVLLDPRNIGRSSAPDVAFTIEQLAADVLALLDHLEIASAHIVGHSIGGRIGLAMALTHPGRVKSLAMVGSGSGSAIRGGEDAIPMPQVRLLERLITRGLEEHVRHETLETDGYFTDDFRKTSPEVVADFYSRSSERHADVRTYVRYMLARHSFEATHRLPFLAVPTHIIIGGKDIAGGGSHLSAAYAMRERMPAAEFTVLEGVSHGLFWQAPDRVNDLLNDWFQKSAS